jgi:hypothetical protein
VYDAGVLIAADRNDRGVWADHRTRLAHGTLPLTTAPVVAQVSRSTRQARLRVFLSTCEVLAFSPEHAHLVGELLARSGTSDAVDAHLVHLAAGAEIVTSDLDDIRVLAEHVTPRPVVRPI